MKYIISILSLFFLSGCMATTSGVSNSQIMGGLGAVTGAAINSNPWKGALIGLAAGAAGGAVMDQRERAMQERQEQLIRAQSQQSQQRHPRTDCQKVRKIRTEHGRVVEDRIEEVCKGQQTYYAY